VSKKREIMNENETFSIPSVNVIKSSLGYSVEILGRYSILYKEDDLSLEFGMDIVTDDSLIVLFKEQWESPANDQRKNADIQRITKNIQRAFLFRGIDISIA